MELDSPESLIQVEHTDLREGDKVKKAKLLEELKDQNIPESLIRINRYIDAAGQVRLLNYLRNNIGLNDCYFTGLIPDNVTLEKVLSLTYQFLFSETDKKAQKWTEAQIIAATKYWVGQKPNIPSLVSYDIIGQSKYVDTRIRNVFTFTSHFLEFAWPKYIKAFANIYNYAALETGNPEINLEYLLMRLEYGADDVHEVALKDAGLPSDIIKKIKDLFVDCETFDRLHDRYPLCAFRADESTNSVRAFAS